MAAVTRILHIGDSISKLGIQTQLRAWLNTNYPSVEFISTDTNNSGVTNAWASFWEEEIVKHEPQLWIVNSGMWDRLVETSEFESKFLDAMRLYKAAHPVARVVWLSTTLCATTLSDYELYNARIVSNNAFAVATLNTIYGVGGWDFIDQYQCAIDNSLTYTDDVHFSPGGYNILAANVTASLGGIIDNYEEPIVPTVPKVAYGACKSGPADFKTGTPTVSIADGVATFSAAQTHALMGVGAEVSYNDGAAKKCYIAPSGKISASQWRITTALGALPADCVDASVSAITHPFDGLNAAFAGHVGAAFLNSADRTATGADVELHIACYMEQDTYTKDSGPGGWDTITFNQSTGDAAHLLYIYAPTDEDTECNLRMFPTAPQLDTTKYLISQTAGAVLFRKNTVAAYLDVSNIQMWHAPTGTNATRTVFSIDPAVSLDYVRVHRCIIATNSPPAGDSSDWRVFFIGVTGGGTYKIHNNILVANASAGTNTGAALHTNVTGITVYFYCNTVYGAFAAPINLVAGQNVFARNNIFLTNGACVGSPDLDYNVYRVDEGDANGTLTTQTDAELLLDVSEEVFVNRNFAITKNSDARNAGTALDTEYSGDLLYNGVRRPQDGGWDCGAFECPIHIIPSILQGLNFSYGVFPSLFQKAKTTGRYPAVTEDESVAYDMLNFQAPFGQKQLAGGGWALSLDGIDDRVYRSAGAPTLNYLTSGTYAFCFRSLPAASVSGTKTLYAVLGAATNFYQIQYTPSSGVVGLRTFSGSQYTHSSSSPCVITDPAAINFIAVSVNAREVVLRINSIKQVHAQVLVREMDSGREALFAHDATDNVGVAADAAWCAYFSKALSDVEWETLIEAGPTLGLKGVATGYDDAYMVLSQLRRARGGGFAMGVGIGVGV